MASYTEGRELLAKLAACYLYPKSFLESESSPTGITEGPVAHGLDPLEWHQTVAADLENYYGQFVTRLLMDHATIISPHNRFPMSNAIFGKFFNLKDTNQLCKALRESMFHFDDECGGGDVIVEPGMNPILWSLAALDKKLSGKDTNYPQFVFEDSRFSSFAESFLAQLDIGGSKEKLVDSMVLLSYLLSEGSGQEEYLSKGLRHVHDNHDFWEFHQFCDLVLFHQTIEALFRRVATPYHVNVEKTRRWSYQAKDTPMFMDSADTYSEREPIPNVQRTYRY